MAFPVAYIREILVKDGVVPAEAGRHKGMTRAKYEQSDLKDDIKEVFEDLGGKTDVPPFASRPYDLEFLTKVVVFDDELYFNRYRTITFRSEVYDKLNIPVQSYRKWCRNEEKECIKAGVNKNIWTNPEAEKYFGEPEEPGDFGLNGSPGWKLNAWKDYLADVSARLNNFEIVRISVYEELMIDGRLTRLKNLLLHRNPDNEKYIVNFIRRKMGMEIPKDPFGEDYRKEL